MSLEGNITWKFLKDLSDALNSYRVRALIDAKSEILDTKVYDEDQYYGILFSLIREEKNKYALYNYLLGSTEKNLNTLKRFSKKKKIPLSKTFSYLELLNAENLIAIKKEFIGDEIQKDENDEFLEKELKEISISIISSDPLKQKPIYEPVSVIFNNKICSGCGLCAGICPVDCIEINNGFGKVDEDLCIRCGLCYFVCPRTFLPMDLLNLFQSNSETYKTSDKIGPYLEIYGARTKVDEIKQICQDGGITSTCLYYLFKNKKVDYALGAKMSEKLWCPEPYLIENDKDVLKTSGTKYVNNPNLVLLNTNKLFNESKIAVVGVPCMMQALLKTEIFNNDFPSLRNIIYRIGIFCMESFPYEEGFLKICKKLDVAIEDIKKTDINKGKFFIFTKDGRELTIPIKEISNLAREDCELCYDLTSESADISIGSIGAPSGWNCVVIRTEKGKKLYEALINDNLIESKPIQDIKPGLPLLKKIAGFKKSGCSKHISKKQKNERVPLY